MAKKKVARGPAPRGEQGYLRGKGFYSHTTMGYQNALLQFGYAKTRYIAMKKVVEAKQWMLKNYLLVENAIEQKTRVLLSNNKPPKVRLWLGGELRDDVRR